MRLTGPGKSSKCIIEDIKVFSGSGTGHAITREPGTSESEQVLVLKDYQRLDQSLTTAGLSERRGYGREHSVKAHVNIE